MASDPGDYAAFTTTAGAAKAGRGRLRKVVVTTTVTGTITIYDHPSAASGTVLYASAANPAAGTVVDLNVRAKQGMWVVPGSAGAFLVLID
jgi:hypothetical protein